jgi:hypothetical protein
VSLACLPREYIDALEGFYQLLISASMIPVAMDSRISTVLIILIGNLTDAC